MKHVLKAMLVGAATTSFALLLFFGIVAAFAVFPAQAAVICGIFVFVFLSYVIGNEVMRDHAASLDGFD